MMNEEVRYAYLRPDQIVEKRSACPIAYLPIGTLEWHGVHNALGADTLQAEGLAIRCARKGGGLVLPPLYYGENRLDSLMEAVAKDREDIAAQMKLSSDRFTPQRFPYSAGEQAKHYQTLLMHLLAQMDTLGFHVGVLVVGHYPLIDHARAAVLQYHQRLLNGHQEMLAWAFVDYLLIQDLYEDAGDHAARWETSHMLALHPETVDLTKLPDRGEKLVGVMGKTWPQDATAEFGEEILMKAADVAVAETQHRLEHRQAYQSHGAAFREGLWRKP